MASFVILTPDGSRQMGQQSLPGPQADQQSVQKSPPGLQRQNVHLQSYAALRAPTSGTGQKPRDVSVGQTQESTGQTSSGSFYHVAPAAQMQEQGGDRFHFDRSFFNPGLTSNKQQLEGYLQFDSSSKPYMADVEATRRLPQNAARVSPPRYQSYIIQSKGGYVHAAERMSHSKYDPSEMSSHGFGAAEFPVWAADDTPGHSGGLAQSSQQTPYQAVVHNSPMGSAGNYQQAQSGSHNLQRYHPVQSNYVAPAVGPGFFSSQAGFWPTFLNTRQSQGNYGPVSSHSAQQSQHGYQSVQNMPNMFAQGFRQKV